MEGKQALLDREDIERQVKQLDESIDDGEMQRAAELAEHLSNRRVRDILITVRKENILPFLRELGWKRADKIIAWLPEELTLELLKEMDEKEQRQMFARLDSDEIADLLDHLPVEEQSELWEKLHPFQEEGVRKLAAYDPESAGGHMEVEFITVGPKTSVEEALSELRRKRKEIDNTDYLYITDEGDRLVGVVSVQDLSFAGRATRVENLMEANVHVARVDDPVEEAAKTLKYRRFALLPVVTSQDRMVGVLTLDTAIEQLSEELAEDFVSLSGSIGEESFFTDPRSAIKMRLPWMAGNVFLNLGAVAIISGFEATIEQIAILAAFLPMITDMGGNVGIQALSVSIRSIALGEVQLGDIWRAIRKEMTIGVFNGLCLGMLFAILAYFLGAFPLLGAVAGVALATNVLVAGVVGGTFPFLIKKLGGDPAMMTGPFLTTVTDITGVTIYLGLSTVLLLNGLT